MALCRIVPIVLSLEEEPEKKKKNERIESNAPDIFNFGAAW